LLFSAPSCYTGWLADRAELKQSKGRRRYSSEQKQQQQQQLAASSGKGGVNYSRLRTAHVTDRLPDQRPIQRRHS